MIQGGFPVRVGVGMGGQVGLGVVERLAVLVAAFLLHGDFLVDDRLEVRSFISVREIERYYAVLALEDVQVRGGVHVVHVVVHFVLPNHRVLLQTEQTEEVVLTDVVFDEAQNARLLFRPVRMMGWLGGEELDNCGGHRGATVAQ